MTPPSAAPSPPDLLPPGEFIRDELEARNWTQEDLADILGRPLSAVNQIITGKKAITSQTALELAAAFGTSPELWLNLENAYRLALTRRETGPVVKRAQLYERAPIKEMIRRQWIAPPKSVEALERSVLEFFEISAVDETPRLNHAARKSSSYDATTPQQLAWYFRVKQLANTLRVPAFDDGRARQFMPRVRQLAETREGIARLPQTLAEMGIRFVLVEQLPGSRIDGATLWENDERPVVALTLRHDRIDGFWHTLAHELMHVLNRQTAIDIDLVRKDTRSNTTRPPSEHKIDREASNFLVSSKHLDAFVSHYGQRIPKQGIVRFAEQMRVHPGIIVGQLHFRGAMPYSHCRQLLVGVRELLATTALTDGWA